MKSTKNPNKIPANRRSLEIQIEKALVESNVKPKTIRADKISAVIGHRKSPSVLLIYVTNERYIYGPDPTKLDGMRWQNAIIENVGENLHAIGYSWSEENHRYERHDT